MSALPGAVNTYVSERRDYSPDQLQPEQLRVPVLLIHGTGDRVVPIAVAEDLADRIPGSRLARVELAGHMLPITHSEPLATRIRLFARGDSPR
jgi:pimeloyl-ACP methyl ester carboxylesterase